MFSLCDLVPGNWYITLMCSCEGKAVLFLDRTNGKAVYEAHLPSPVRRVVRGVRNIAAHYYYGQGVPNSVAPLE